MLYYKKYNEGVNKMAGYDKSRLQEMIERYRKEEFDAGCLRMLSSSETRGPYQSAIGNCMLEMLTLLEEQNALIQRNNELLAEQNKLLREQVSMQKQDNRHRYVEEERQY